MAVYKEIFEEVVNDCYEGRILKCFKGIQEEWKVIEQPKATNELASMIDQCFSVCERFNAYKTASQLIQLRFCQNIMTLCDIGNEECIIGKVAYGQGNLEVAKELLTIANKLSSGVELRAERYKKYRDLVSGKMEIDAKQTIRGRLLSCLSNESLDEKATNQILKDFEPVLDKWDKLKEPRILKTKAYDLIKQLILLCIKHQLYDLGNECIGLLLTRITKHPDDGEREFIAGKLAYEQKHLAVAQQFFWVAGQKSKEACWEEKGSEIYKELLEVEGLELDFDPEIYEIAKQLSSQSGEPDKTENEVEEEITELPPELYERVSKIYDEGELLNGEAAIAKYEEGLKLLPGDAGDWDMGILFYAAIGDEYRAQEEYEEAINYYDYAIDFDEIHMPYLLFGKGMCFYELGDMEQAEEYFIQTYMLDGKSQFDGEDEKYYQCIKHMVE